MSQTHGPFRPPDPTSAVEPCGCIGLGHAVHFCPLHAAAEGMRDALTSLVDCVATLGHDMHYIAHDKDLARTCSPDEPQGCGICSVRALLRAVEKGGTT